MFRVLVIYNFAGFVKRGEALEGKKVAYISTEWHILYKEKEKKNDFGCFQEKKSGILSDLSLRV